MNKTTRCWVSALTLAATLALPAHLFAEDAPAAPPATPSAGAPKDGKKHPDRPPGDRLEAMREQRDAWIKEIGATDEQMAKIREATKEQADKGRELRADTTLSPEDRRAKMKEIREAMSTKMKGILTPDQFAKYQKLQEQRREQMNRGEGRPPQPRAPKPDGAKPDESK